MSVNWNWNDKCGTFTIRQEVLGKDGDWKDYEVSIYNGNCMAVFLYEYKDEETGKDKYEFFGFFADKAHAKNCLGLSKGYENIYCTPYQQITRICLEKKKCRYFKDLVALFAQAFNDIDIVIRSAVEVVEES